MYDETAYNYFKEKRTEYPKLSERARKIIAVLPSRAIAGSSFSKASFMTENRKNRLKIENLKTRLIIFGHDPNMEFELWLNITF